MMVQIIQNSSGFNYTAAIEFHDGRKHILGPIFRTQEDAREFGEGWVRQAVASYARALAEAGRHLQAVEG